MGEVDTLLAPEPREPRRPRKKLRSIDTSRNDISSASPAVNRGLGTTKRTRLTGAEEDDEYKDDSEPESSYSPPRRRATRSGGRSRVSFARHADNQAPLEEPMVAETDDAAQGEQSRADQEDEGQGYADASMEELSKDHQDLLDARERGESVADFILKFNLKNALVHEFLPESSLIVKSRSGEWVELHCPICKGNTQAPGELAIFGLNFFRNHLDIAHDINEPDDQELVELCTKRVCDFGLLRAIVKGVVKPRIVHVKAPGEMGGGNEEERDKGEVDTADAPDGDAASDVAVAGDLEEQDTSVAPTWDFSTLG